MNFKQKRISYGLEAYTVAKELGIPYMKYLDVEKGKLDLDTSKKEKFSEIMSRSGELKAETYSKNQQIYED